MLGLGLLCICCFCKHVNMLLYTHTHAHTPHLSQPSTWTKKKSKCIQMFPSKSIKTEMETFIARELYHLKKYSFLKTYYNVYKLHPPTQPVQHWIYYLIFSYSNPDFLPVFPISASSTTMSNMLETWELFFTFLHYLIYLTYYKSC